MCLDLLAYSKKQHLDWTGGDWHVFTFFFLKIFFLFLKIISTGPLLARDAREGSESSSASRKQAFSTRILGLGRRVCQLHFERGSVFLNMVLGV